MSMFTRNDKVPDTSTDQTAQPRENPPVSATPAAKPPQAIAQPPSKAAVPLVPSVSVISKALKITGQLESTEDIRIDGEVDGDVRGVFVTVGSGAKVKGTVYGSTVELSGTIDGKIEAEKVVLTNTARMSGDVVHQDIRIESGAFIDGHCRPGIGKNGDQPAHPTSNPVSAPART